MAPFSQEKNGMNIAYLGFADDLLLFLEATTQQAAMVMGMVDEFYQSSGLSINLNKSKVFFSNMVPQLKRRMLMARLGIACTPYLGTYLGMPIIHGRKSVRHFEFILDKL